MTTKLPAPQQFKHNLRAFAPMTWDAVISFDKSKQELKFSALTSNLQASLSCQVHLKSPDLLSPPNPPLSVDVKKLYACVRPVMPKDTLEIRVGKKLDKLYLFLSINNGTTSTFSLPLYPSENELPVPAISPRPSSFRTSVPFKAFQNTVNHHLTVSGQTTLYCAVATGEFFFETKCKDTGTEALTRLPTKPKCNLPSRHMSGGLRSHALGEYPLSTLRAVSLFGHTTYTPVFHIFMNEGSELLHCSNTTPTDSPLWRFQASLPSLEVGELPPPPPPSPTPPAVTSERPIKRKKKNPAASKNAPRVLKPLPGGKLLNFQEAEKKHRPLLFCNPEKGLWLPGHERPPVWPNQIHSEEAAASHKHVCQYNWCLYPLDRSEEGHKINSCPHLFAKAKADLAADVTGSGTESALQGWLSCWDMHSQMAASQIPWNQTYLC